jgi:hypothetical protein
MPVDRAVRHPLPYGAMESEGAPPFHPEWRKRVDRTLAERALCLDCMATQIDIPKRYLGGYLAWMRRNVVIMAKRACEVCGSRHEIYSVPKG